LQADALLELRPLDRERSYKSYRPEIALSTDFW
jgi:hypothetical protein